MMAYEMHGEEFIFGGNWVPLTHHWTLAALVESERLRAMRRSLIAVCSVLSDAVRAGCAKKGCFVFWRVFCASSRYQIFRAQECA